LNIPVNLIDNAYKEWLKLKKELGIKWKSYIVRNVENTWLVEGKLPNIKRFVAGN
jgi:hypothetical protein